MDPSLQPARTVEIVLEFLQLLQQHEDVFAACGEIGRTCSGFCPQPWSWASRSGSRP